MDYAAFMKDLAPQDVFHHFYHLSQIPRDAGDYDGICAIEWAENIKDFFWENTVTVKFEKLGETVRKITIEGDNF